MNFLWFDMYQVSFIELILKSCNTWIVWIDPECHMLLIAINVHISVHVIPVTLTANFWVVPHHYEPLARLFVSCCNSDSTNSWVLQSVKFKILSPSLVVHCVIWIIPVILVKILVVSHAVFIVFFLSNGDSHEILINWTLEGLE